MCCAIKNETNKIMWIHSLMGFEEFLLVRVWVCECVGAPLNRPINQIRTSEVNENRKRWKRYKIKIWTVHLVTHSGRSVDVIKQIGQRATICRWIFAIYRTFFRKSSINIYICWLVFVCRVSPPKLTARSGYVVCGLRRHRATPHSCPCSFQYHSISWINYLCWCDSLYRPQIEKRHCQERRFAIKIYFWSDSCMLKIMMIAHVFGVHGFSRNYEKY